MNENEITTAQVKLHADARNALRAKLRELRRINGDRSTHAIATKAHCSHTTVAAVLALRRLPPWRTVRSVITAMGGTPDDDEWLALYTAAADLNIHQRIHSADDQLQSWDTLAEILAELRAIRALLEERLRP